MIDQDELIAVLRVAVEDAGSPEALAQRWHIPTYFITDVLRGYRDPGKSILKPLGYDLVKMYRRIDDEPRPDHP